MSSQFNVEYTDTFGGEANYSWVKRAVVTIPDWDKFSDWDGNGRREPKGYQAYVMREAKRAIGITGLRGRTTSFGDGYEFRPHNVCAVMFVSYKDA